MNDKKNKKEIRRRLLSTRKTMEQKDVLIYSQQITEKVISLKDFKEAKQVLIYLDHENEVMTRAIIHVALSAGKVVGLPKVIGKGVMDFYQITSLDGLVPSKMNIFEPPSTFNKVLPDDCTLLIVPGVAYDINRNRLGYGGGYYDRYINRYHIDSHVAIAYNYQVIDHVPSDDYDMLINRIITESQTIS